MNKLLFFIQTLVRIALVATCLLAIFGFLPYMLWGHKIIAAAYNERSLPFLNNIIEGRHVHPLTFYFKLADQFLFPWELIVLKLINILTLLYAFLWLVQKRSWAMIIITALFLWALWVRFPNLDRPLGDHHEWVTEHTLIILKNWEAQGALQHGFRLLMTFPGDCNKWVFDYFGRLMSPSGDGYYVSFPPGAVLWPYLIFKLFSLPVSVFGLQSFNILCHLISTLIFFGIIKKILSSSFYPKDGIALIGAIFFIFMPSHLWFFSNIYSWDIFWFYAWIAAVALTLHLKERIDTHQPYPKALFFLGLNLFVLIYSDYYGVLYAFTVILWAASHLRRDKAYKDVIFTVLISTIVTILLTIIQNASVDSLNSLMQCLISNRKNYPFNGLEDLTQLSRHAEVAFRVAAWPVFAAILWLIVQEKKKIFSLLSSPERTALYLFFFPSFIFLIVQIHWSSVHDYSMLRWTPFFILLFIILLSKIRLPLYWPIKILVCFLIFKFIVLSISYYQACFVYSGDVSFFQRQGEAIQKNSKPDETIFAITAMTEGIDPRFTYYIKKNVQVVQSNLEALGWLSVYQKPKGVVFTLDEQKGILGIERVSLQDIKQLFKKENISTMRIDQAGFNQISSVDFYFNNGTKRRMEFKNGSLVHNTLFDAQGQKSEELVTDYWTLTSDSYEYTAEGVITDHITR